MPAVGAEAVIQPHNRDIVVQTCGCAKHEACVVQTIPGGRIVRHRVPGAERLVEVAGVIGQVEHSGINPETLGVKKLELGGVPDGGSGVAGVYVLEYSLAQRGGRNHALGALLLAFASPLVVGKEEQPVL